MVYQLSGSQAKAKVEQLLVSFLQLLGQFLRTQGTKFINLQLEPAPFLKSLLVGYARFPDHKSGGYWELLRSQACRLFSCFLTNTCYFK